MATSFDVIRAGRDKVSAILAPHLGQSMALERANNIAQALLMGDEDPHAVTLEMLRHVEVDDAYAVAAEVTRAWRSSCPPDDDGARDEPDPTATAREMAGRGAAIHDACGTSLGPPMLRDE